MPTEQSLIFVTGRELLNALPANAALLAPDGEIKAVNNSWINFGEQNGLRLPNHGVKANYFAICEAADGPDREVSVDVAHGVYELMHGLRSTFSAQYPCHSPTQRRWFLLNATRVGRQVPSPVLLLHEDVSFLMFNQERLAKINAELERVATFISHDVRAPLHTIESCLELIRADVGNLLQQSTETYFDAVDSTIKRLSTFATEVLNFALLGQQHQLPMESLAINTVVLEALQNIARLIDEYNAKVTVDPLGSAPANFVYLVQLFQNLISNAIIHSGKNARVHVGLTRGEKQDLYFVQDFGPGIPPEFHDMIFLPFSRPNTAATGTGLGLAICRNIVAHHGGQISVESRPGQGTTFYFSLAPENDGRSRSNSNLESRN